MKTSTKVIAALPLFASMLSSVLAMAKEYHAGADVDCAAVMHKPAADVEYQAGVSASGYAVAPADITPPALSAQDFKHVEMPLNLPLGAHLQADKYNANSDRMELNAGSVAVDAATGGVSFNGKDVFALDAAALNPDCAGR